jgi:hypothetical protein
MLNIVCDMFVMKCNVTFLLFVVMSGRIHIYDTSVILHVLCTSECMQCSKMASRSVDESAG